jgi:ATP-binding cassette, subfamily B, multidrug efflux pump
VGKASASCRRRPYLFSGTVASNLRYGKPDATEDDLWEALEIAQAEDFVAAMPGGLEAPDRPGRHQRLRWTAPAPRHRPSAGPRPEVYLFDDSFSALDVATDARLRAALERGTATPTVIVVAQRVFTITRRRPDRRARDGRVVGIGTHDELLETCTTYEEIVDSQLKVEAS